MSRIDRDWNVKQPNLSRLWCDGCKEETLHKGFYCVHCGEPIKLKPLKPSDKPSVKLRKTYFEES